jgi:hypothetical protein
MPGRANPRLGGKRAGETASDVIGIDKNSVFSPPARKGILL